jgi:hypothetical protein
MKQTKAEHNLRINLVKSYLISLPIIAVALYFWPYYAIDILVAVFAVFNPLIQFALNACTDCS